MHDRDKDKDKNKTNIWKKNRWRLSIHSNEESTNHFPTSTFYTMNTIFEQKSILAKLNALNKKKHIYFEYKYIKIKVSKKETAKEQNKNNK